MKVYADASFLVSLYSLDANSAAAARAVKASTGERFVTILGELEVLNAFGLRVFRKEVTAAQAQSSLTDFEKDLRDGLFQLRGLPDPIFERARQLSRQTTAKLGSARPTFCTSLRHSNWVLTTFTALTNTSENSHRRFVLKLTEISSAVSLPDVRSAGCIGQSVPNRSQNCDSTDLKKRLLWPTRMDSIQLHTLDCGPSWLAALAQI